MRISLAVLSVTAAALLLSPSPGAQTAAATRTVYVSATGDKDAPVRDLTSVDLTVKEDGKAREIVSVEPATTPMQIVLMLDDSGLSLGSIRQGAGQFVEALQNKAEFAVIALGASNRVLVDFTKDARVVYAGLEKMLTRNSPPVYILDGLVEVAQTLKKREAQRPVIVTVATEGDELSSARAEVVLDAIQKSGARLYYLGLGAPVTAGNKPAYSADRPEASTEYESGKRNTVIGAAPKNSGGRSEQALQASGIPVMMKSFADELANQYAVSYKTDATGESKLTIETKKKSVKVRAPARVGGK